MKNRYNISQILLFILILTFILFPNYTFANPIKWFLESAENVALQIANSLTKTNKLQVNTLSNVQITQEKINEILKSEPTSEDLLNLAILQQLINSYQSNLSANKNYEINILNNKLNILEKLYDEDFVNVTESIISNKNTNKNINSSVGINKEINNTQFPKIDINLNNDKKHVAKQSNIENSKEKVIASKDNQNSGLISKLKDINPNSSQFKSLLEKFKEDLKPETKSYIIYQTSSESTKKILPPDFEVRANSGIKIWQDRFDDQKLFSQSYSYSNNGPDAIQRAYTSNYLNLNDDPQLAQKTLAKISNKEFDNIRLNQGNTKFGWTHIAYDRPDGTCHAREIKEAFGLKDQDESVRKFILETIKTGKATEQIRERDGKLQSRMIYTRTVDGKEIKVVVDNGEHKGSIITAYPTGKVKIPTPDEIKKKVEEERKKLSEAAKKDLPWLKPSISIDLYKNEIGKTLGPQLKAGIDNKYKLGGATLFTSAKGDALLIGAEAKGASYVGIRNGQLAAGLSGNLFVGTKARGEVASGIQIGKIAGRAFVGGETSVGAGANADANINVGKDGLGAGITGDAFIGVRAKGQVGCMIAHGTTSVTGTLSGSVGVGLGANFEAKGKISWSGVQAKVNLGAYLGVGGQVGFDVNVNFGDALKPVRQVVERIYDKSKTQITKISQNIRNELDKHKTVVSQFFKWK